MQQAKLEEKTKNSIDNIKDIPNDEKRTEISLDVTEFDADEAYLEVKEELDKKTIDYIEREVRNSFEYREYINYLKNELDLTKCSILPGIDIKETAVRLEFHHYPLSLYDITEIVGKDMISKLSDDERVSCFDIAEKVVEEHYRNNIGLVPLTISMHKAAHNRSIIVPITAVNGNYDAFLAKYADSIPQEIKDRVSEIKINSVSDDAKEYNKAKLEKNILNFSINYYKEDKDGKDEE